MERYLSAEDAARRLGVSRQTLYAYVSRGHLKAHAGAGDDPRRSLYLTEEVELLAKARRRGRRPKEIARSALDWGVPVLESALTLIAGERLYFRGVDAVALSQAASLEQVAGLLWQVPVAEAFPAVAPAPAPAYEALLPLVAHRPGNETLLPLFCVAADDDATAFWRTDAAREARGCGDLVRHLTAAALRGRPDADPIHRQLARAFALDAEGADLVRRALVLCADHELNASAFTARCVASAGAALRAAVIGGLAALSGFRHGSMTARVEDFWNALGDGDRRARLRRRLDGGQEVPGFGHPLYPGGDVRAAALLERVLPRFAEAREIVDHVAELTGIPPSVDFALVAVRRHLGLPEGTAFLLFALGRSVGWIAHAREQRAAETLIRPRAIYTGPSPSPAAPAPAAAGTRMAASGRSAAKR